MNKALFWVTIILSVAFIITNIVFLSMFYLSSVGLTSTEEAMLVMTRNQIHQLHVTSDSVLNVLSLIPNRTLELVELTTSLAYLKFQQESHNASIPVLQNRSITQYNEMIAFNSTINNKMSVVQDKIDTISIIQLDLEYNSTISTHSNGTVLLSNPNNRNESTILKYKIRSQNDITFIEVGQQGESLFYDTIGSNNWVSLIDWSPPIFINNTIGSGSFTSDQLFDEQRNKISSSPTIGTREYNTDNNELKLVFEGTVTMSQNITLNNVLTLSIGFI